MNIQIATGDITDFEGDVIIIPSDSELTYTKSFSLNPNYPLFKHESKKGLIKNLFEKAGKELVRELTAVGYCEVGYAVAVQGYNLKAKHIIFMPITEHNNEDVRINYIGLHQSLRAAFELANLYKAKSVAIAGIHILSKKGGFLKRLWSKYFDGNEAKLLRSDEIEDIIISTSKNLENSSIKELTIYKYSK
jgi:O-acetyl-ADP-ribose deacetylase (regulator of RNase III)